MGTKYLIRTMKLVEEYLRLDDYSIRESDWLIVDPEKTFTINIFDKTYIQAVRCKDCKYWRSDRPMSTTMPEFMDMCKCNVYPIYTKSTDFCSKGERKESEK